MAMELFAWILLNGACKFVNFDIFAHIPILLLQN